MEKFVSRENIYNGKVINVVKDEILINDSQKSYREVVLHNGGACIALKNKEGKYLLVKQYRYAQQDYMYEFCAGKLEKDEDPLEAIKREAIEETGYEAKNIKQYPFMAPTCGYCAEKIYLFSGEVDAFKGQKFDDDENVEIVELSLKEIVEMIDDGRIYDAKTICIVYHLLKEELNGKY